MSFPVITEEMLADVAEFAAQYPVLIHSDPGQGLHAALSEAARAADAVLVVVQCPMIDWSEGWEDRSLPSFPRWQREIADVVKDGQAPWVYFEELTSAAPAVGRALVEYMRANGRMMRIIASDTTRSTEFAARWQLDGGSVFVWTLTGANWLAYLKRGGA